MFANKKRCLARYLRVLATEKPCGAGDCSQERSGPELIRAFRDLLLFWQDHYLHKDKDCSALEKSSRIRFDYWKQTVVTLVADRRGVDTCLLYYMDLDCDTRMS